MTLTDADFVVHLSPVWRQKANFIIDAKIAHKGSPRKVEQMWSRQIDDSHFEICCIPFFVYDLSLGDEVETTPEGERRWVIQRVVKPSGRFTFRAWFGGSANAQARDAVIRFLQEHDSLFEWYSQNLLAIDAADPDKATTIANFLQEEENQGHLSYETGATR